jgi:hypothetical protein
MGWYRKGIRCVEFHDLADIVDCGSFGLTNARERYIELGDDAILVEKAITFRAAEVESHDLAAIVDVFGLGLNGPGNMECFEDI